MFVPGLDMSTTNRVLSFLPDRSPASLEDTCTPSRSVFVSSAPLAFGTLEARKVAKQEYVQRWVTSDRHRLETAYFWLLIPFVAGQPCRDLSNDTIGEIIYFSIFFFLNHLYHVRTVNS
jgi:hypothetical protein